MKPGSDAKVRPWISRLWLAAATTAFGLLLLFTPVRGGLENLSYDLPFCLRPNRAVTHAVLVNLDEISHGKLQQRPDAAWDRALHAKLVNRLMEEGAKAIVFDIIFSGTETDSPASTAFAEAIAKSKRVILAGNYTERETSRGEYMQEMPFTTSAADWGNANFDSDPDFGIRKFFPDLEGLDALNGRTNVAWLPTAVARFLSGQEVFSSQDSSNRWFNFYGPPGTIPAISYYQALNPGDSPPGFYSNKVVFVGALQSADFSGKGKDEFRTPYARFGKGFASGAEIHATATLNLLEKKWLTRLNFKVEVLLVLLVGAGASLGLMRLQPLRATLAAVVASLLLISVACFSVWTAGVWFAWVVLFLQIGVALFGSVVANSLRIYVMNRVLEQSLATRLSPRVIKELMKDPKLREVGGSQHEISILFSDIANFSRVSEIMSSDDLVKLLNRYFETTLACIHETEGTVVNLMGDSIFAIWNAPLYQPDHRERATRAAIRLREQLLEFGETERGLPLRTRVGLHAGISSVGNLGSSTRFDYTAIGESVNLASRLEGMNKHIGTNLLASRELQRAVETFAVWRLLGHFRMKGFGRAVEIHELVGPLECAEKTKVWRTLFDDAMQDFRARRFEVAESKFRDVIEKRRQTGSIDAHSREPQADDGPSLFYLRKIQDFKTQPPSYEWIGEVDLTEK